jgi:predicted HD phosphohydrolase
MSTTETEYTGEVGRSMAEFSADYMTYLEGHLDEDLTHVPDRILSMLRALEGYVQGFAITQLEHSLQTATMAERAGADPDIVVAALCHDIGKIVSNANHPAVSAEIIRPWVSEKAYWIVKHHQDFQGRHYYARIGLDPEMRRRHEGHEFFEAAEEFVDEWDQAAFDPDYDTLPLEHFEPLVREVFSAPPRRG